VEARDLRVARFKKRTNFQFQNTKSPKKEKDQIKANFSSNYKI
jgi:hypothetical protein